jgi:hypothetical protein
MRRAWNWLWRRGGAIEASRWCTYQLQLINADGVTAFVLRQCPICCALVQPTNERFHTAWHIGGSV